MVATPKQQSARYEMMRSSVEQGIVPETFGLASFLEGDAYGDGVKTRSLAIDMEYVVYAVVLLGEAHLWLPLLGGCLDSNMQLGDKRAAVAAKGVPTVLGVSSVSLQHNRLSCVGATTLLEHVDKESLRYLDLGMSYLSRACVTDS